MTILIDQSGKVEDTSRVTVVAYSNDVQSSVLISRKIKRQVQEAFRYHGETSSFVDHVFATVIYFLISDLRTKQRIVIDLEYPGRDKFITKLILNLLDRGKKPMHEINFARIGNRPRVHYTAKDVFDKKKKPTKVLTLKMILDKQKDRWALKRVSSNPGRRSGPDPLVKMLAKKRKMSR